MSYYQMYDALMIQKRRARQLSLLLQKERLERELQPVSDGLFHISMNREQTLKNPFMGPRLATDRATKALDMIFALPEYVDLDFRCVISDLPESAGRFPVGKEISVIAREGAIIKVRTPEDWNTLMLTCWKALMECGVKVSSKCPVGAQPVAVTEQFRTPFSYEGNSPVKTVTITPQDLAQHEIPIKGGKIDENSSWQKLLEIIQDQDYWKSKHPSGKRLPRGVDKMQPYVVDYKQKYPPSKTDRLTLKAQLQAVVKKREKAVFSKKKRDPSTIDLYSCLDSKNGLALSPEFKNLTDDYDQFRQEKRAQNQERQDNLFSGGKP